MNHHQKMEPRHIWERVPASDSEFPLSHSFGISCLVRRICIGDLILLTKQLALYC